MLVRVSRSIEGGRGRMPASSTAKLGFAVGCERTLALLLDHCIEHRFAQAVD